MDILDILENPTDILDPMCPWVVEPILRCVFGIPIPKLSERFLQTIFVTRESN